MANILVTGAAGFIGSHLVDKLVELGHAVVSVDNLKTGNRNFINKGSLFAHTDILDYQELESVFRYNKPDYVFHLAAMAKVGWCEEHTIESNNINVGGTLNLLKLSEKYKVKGFIYSSSSAVYGNASGRSSIEEINRISPQSAYALQKYTAEQYVCMSSIPSISLRYFNVYGTKRQRPNGSYPNVFSAFMRDSKKEKYLTIYGDGKQRRDFIHVYDVVEANIVAMKSLQYKFFSDHRIFNIGTGKSTSINTVAHMFKKPIVYSHPRINDPLYSCADMSYTKALLGFKSNISLRKGFKILQES